MNAKTPITPDNAIAVILTYEELVSLEEALEYAINELQADIDNGTMETSYSDDTEGYQERLSLPAKWAHILNNRIPAT